MYLLDTKNGYAEEMHIKTSQFAVNTTLALQWVQAANGDWYATDRGSDNDYYEATVTMKGRYQELSDIMSEINTNRTTGNNVLFADRFESDEKIFGADIVYTNGLSVTIEEFPDIEQKSLNVFQIKFKLRLLKPYTFVTYVGIPDLYPAQIGYDAKVQDWTINKYDTYKGVYTYIDHNNDAGIFNGTFIFNDTDMAQLRRHHATTRGSMLSISDIPGIYNAFGPNGMVYPIEARIKSISNERMRDPNYWMCNLELINYKVRNAV
jgi:hypothetical protein